jgi:hypothetical protein
MQPDHPGGDAEADADAGGGRRTGRGDGDAVEDAEGLAQRGPRGWVDIDTVGLVGHGGSPLAPGGLVGPGERT